MKKSLESPEQKSKLVLLDVDGTLLHDSPDEISGRLFWIAVKKGIIHPSSGNLKSLERRREHYGQAIGEERQNYLEPLIHEFDRNLHGKSVKAMGDLAAKLVAHDIDHFLYQEMDSEIRDWRHEGATFGIISGSPSFYIEPLGKRLRCFDAKGTEHSHDGNTYHNSTPKSRAKDKHLAAEEMLERLSQQTGRPAELVAAYGDTVNDQSMLELAVEMGGEAVAVNPKNGLAQVAIENNWRVIRSQTLDNVRPVHHNRHHLPRIW